MDDSKQADDYQEDFSVWDFHPDEPTVPAQFQFCTYLEGVKNTLNVLMKKRMKDPILQNTRKLILTANRAEHYTYDEEFKRKHFDEEDLSKADFNLIINREIRKL